MVSKCWLCLCEVCTMVRCPNLYKRYKVNFCASMTIRERCPVPQCDFFQHKQKHKVYRIKRRYTRRDQILSRLDTIERSIGSLTGKL